MVEKGQPSEVVADNGILGPEEELVELVRRGPLRIEPDGSGLGFPELRPVGFQDQRGRETECLSATDLPD